MTDWNNIIDIDDVSKKEIFVIGCYPFDDIRRSLLEKQIDILQRYADIPILVVSHCPISEKVQASIDYVLYDKENRLGTDVAFKFNHFYDNGDVMLMSKIPALNYHAPAILTNMKNALRFCDGRYGIIHYVESDFFFFIEKYLNRSRECFNSGKKFFGFFSDFDDDVDGGLMSFDVKWMNEKMPKDFTWDDYKKIDHYMKIGDDDPGQLIFEPWFYRYLFTFDMLKDSEILSNRKEYVIVNNALQSVSGDRLFVSETRSNALILFVTMGISYRTNVGKRYKLVERFGNVVLLEGKIEQMQSVWFVTDKRDTVIDLYMNELLVDSVIIDKDYIYNDTVFFFRSGVEKCIDWYGDMRVDPHGFELGYSLRKIDKLMIVAHPDDESIFGGNALLSEKGWRVLCLTGGDDEVRSKEFKNAMVLAGVDVFDIWDYEDSLDKPFNSSEIIKKINDILSQNLYKKIITHNSQGEYGHIQHLSLHNIVKDLVKDNLWVFGYSENKLLDNNVKNKIEMLEMYKSQATMVDPKIPCLPSYEKYIFNEEIVLWKKV